MIDEFMELECLPQGDDDFACWTTEKGAQVSLPALLSQGWKISREWEVSKSKRLRTWEGDTDTAHVTKEVQATVTRLLLSRKIPGNVHAAYP